MTVSWFSSIIYCWHWTMSRSRFIFPYPQIVQDGFSLRLFRWHARSKSMFALWNFGQGSFQWLTTTQLALRGQKPGDELSVIAVSEAQKWLYTTHLSSLPVCKMLVSFSNLRKTLSQHANFWTLANSPFKSAIEIIRLGFISLPSNTNSRMLHCW